MWSNVEHYIWLYYGSSRYCTRCALGLLALGARAAEVAVTCVCRSRSGAPAAFPPLVALVRKVQAQDFCSSEGWRLRCGNSQPEFCLDE